MNVPPSSSSSRSLPSRASLAKSRISAASSTRPLRRHRERSGATKTGVGRDGDRQIDARYRRIAVSVQEALASGTFLKARAAARTAKSLSESLIPSELAAWSSDATEQGINPAVHFQIEMRDRSFRLAQSLGDDLADSRVGDLVIGRRSHCPDFERRREAGGRDSVGRVVESQRGQDVDLDDAAGRPTARIDDISSPACKAMLRAKGLASTST